MFLVRGPIHHEQAWRRWFASAGGLLPVNATQVGRGSPGPACKREAGACGGGEAAVLHTLGTHHNQSSAALHPLTCASQQL